MSYIVSGFKKKLRYVFAITDKTEGILIGEISLNLNASGQTAELGYWLGEPFWGKCLMTEAATGILNFGFNKLDLSQVYASTNPDNIPSIVQKTEHDLFVLQSLLIPSCRET